MKKFLTKSILLSLILAPLSGCQFFKKKSAEPTPVSNETTDTTTKKSTDLEKLESFQQDAAKGASSIDEANEVEKSLESATKTE